MQEIFMMMKPLHDKVLVRRVEEATKTASGIFIPDSSKEKPAEGEVVAIGTDKELTVKVGDKVLFEKWGGTEVKVGDEDLLIMKEEKILGILQ